MSRDHLETKTPPKKGSVPAVTDWGSKTKHPWALLFQTCLRADLSWGTAPRAEHAPHRHSPGRPWATPCSRAPSWTRHCETNEDSDQVTSLWLSPENGQKTMTECLSENAKAHQVLRIHRASATTEVNNIRYNFIRVLKYNPIYWAILVNYIYSFRKQNKTFNVFWSCMCLHT